MSRRCARWMAACALLTACAHADDGLGRLFTTPDERAMLDAARESPVPVATPLQLPITGSVRFDGLILRRGAPVRAWLNGQGALPDDLRARTDNTVDVQSQGLWLRHSAKRLKAGQTGVSHAR